MSHTKQRAQQEPEQPQVYTSSAIRAKGIFDMEDLNTIQDAVDALRYLANHLEAMAADGVVLDDEDNGYLNLSTTDRAVAKKYGGFEYCPDEDGEPLWLDDEK